MEAITIKHLKNLPETAYFEVEVHDDKVIIACVRGSFVCVSFGKAAKMLNYKLSLVKRAEGISLTVTPGNWDQAKLYLSLLAKGIDDKTLLRSIG